MEKPGQQCVHSHTASTQNKFGSKLEPRLKSTELWKQVDIRSGWGRERSHLEDSDYKVLEYQVEASGFIPGIKLLESLD